MTIKPLDPVDVALSFRATYDIAIRDERDVHSILVSTARTIDENANANMPFCETDTFGKLASFLESRTIEDTDPEFVVVWLAAIAVVFAYLDIDPRDLPISEKILATVPFEQLHRASTDEWFTKSTELLVALEIFDPRNVEVTDTGRSFAEFGRQMAAVLPKMEAFGAFVITKGGGVTFVHASETSDVSSAMASLGASSQLSRLLSDLAQEQMRSSHVNKASDMEAALRKTKP